MWCTYCGDFAYTGSDGNPYYYGALIPASQDNGRGFQQAQAGCPPGVDCDYVERATKDGLNAATFSIGVVESNYSIWESNYNHTTYPTTKGQMKTIYKPDGRYRSARAAQFGAYSSSVKRVGFGLSFLSISLGGAQLYSQIQNGEPIDPINAAQVGVGTIGLGASFLNYLGLGGRAMAPISATAGVLGMVLSIPSSWYNVYKGAYDLQHVSTPYYPSDAEVFGGN